MTDCVHRSLFTTNIHRFSVTEGRFKPHASHTVYSTEFQELPWDENNWFRFSTNSFDLVSGKFEVRLELYDEKMDLEYAVWTEDQKGNLLKGSKLCHELNNMRIKANSMVEGFEEPTVALEFKVVDNSYPEW
ncbi:hypothetical protein M3Y98_00707100 [Aphelenchoides besseyi]|nr:hypothetical protein M3Y98_00707100 [Aphelenchoides besseyi]